MGDVIVTRQYGDGGSQDYLVSQMQGFSSVRSLISRELTGLFQSETLRDMQHIIKMYTVYLQGAGWHPEYYDQVDTEASRADLHFKIIKGLVDKEARFMFSNPPTINVEDALSDNKDDKRVEVNQQLVQAVLRSNRFNSKLIRAAKDCLIGKRIALCVNFNDNAGIDVSFIPSLEFIYETNPVDVDIMTKFVWFYHTVVNDSQTQQRVYRKKWELGDDGYVYIEESMCDGAGNVMEEMQPLYRSELTEIPIYIIVNDGLTGDPFGVSEIESLEETESWYSKLSNQDIESLRRGADQIVYTVDANPKTTKNLSRRAGSYWDLSSDPAAEGRQANVGVIDNDMSYSGALDSTLGRFKAQMFSQLDVPDTSNDQLQGIITSGKTMRAIYWGLTTRCNEKMLEWQPAIENAVSMILGGVRVYPNCAAYYGIKATDIVEDYRLVVENNYAILDDESEEKATAMLEVTSKVRSRKSYLKEYFGLSDDEADAELEQMALEAEMFDNVNYGLTPDNGDGVVEKDGTEGEPSDDEGLEDFTEDGENGDAPPFAPKDE